MWNQLQRWWRNMG